MQVFFFSNFYEVTLIQGTLLSCSSVLSIVKGSQKTICRLLAVAPVDSNRNPTSHSLPFICDLGIFFLFYTMQTPYFVRGIMDQVRLRSKNPLQKEEIWLKMTFEKANSFLQLWAHFDLLNVRIWTFSLLVIYLKSNFLAKAS